MAHYLHDVLHRISNTKPEPCDDKCSYYRFEHLDTACILSEVFSVLKGANCFIKKIKKGAA